MAFSLTKDYENSGPTRDAAADMGSISAELEALKGDFSSAFDSLDSTGSSINFGDWDDQVQVRVQTYLTDVMMQTAQTVKTSSDAAIATMISTANSLETQLNALADKQDEYVKLKASEPPKTITKYYDDKGYECSYLKEGGSSYSVSNPAWDTWDKNMYTATVVMDGMFSTVNGDFASLASIKFDAANPSSVVPSGGSGGNNDNDADQQQTNAPVFDKNGGADGRHFSSREDAIAAYIAANPGASREEAETVVNRRLKNATLFIPPDKVDEVFVAGEQLTEEAAMASGIAIPTEETVETSDPEHLGDTDNDGEENYRQGQHTEQDFETADGQTAHRTEDLAISGEIEKDEEGGETLIPETATGEAHYTTSDGETYTGEIDMVYGHRGASFDKHEEITADRTGEEVATVDTNQVMEYKDSWTGADVNVTDTTVQQNGTVSGQRQVVHDTGTAGQRYEETSQWSYTIPKEGDPVTEGRYVSNDYGTTHTYTYSRDDQGRLIETDSYHTDGFPIFHWGAGDKNDTRVVDETVYTLRVTDPSGAVTETPIILDSQLGFAEVARQYENARIDVGYRADYAREGIHFLYMGDGSPVEVSSVWDTDGTNTYTFQLVGPDD